MFNIPESCIMSRRKLCMLLILAKAGRAKCVEVNEPYLSYRAIIYRNKLYFY